MDCDKESRINDTNGRDEISSWSNRIYVYRSRRNAKMVAGGGGMPGF
jgi:hypothetical protein